MADVTEAPNQDAIAESLLGPEEQEQQVEQPEAEQPEVQETQEQPQEQEQLEPEQEAAEDWLPSEQDKVFPDEVLSRYCERYGVDPVALTNPQLRQLLVDKINTDIYVQQLREQEQQQEPEPEAELEPTQAQPQISREQYFSNLERVIAE